ncbi:MAG: hypothetical protein ACRDDZ_05195 [Marinifilaceae bacterium]
MIKKLNTAILLALLIVSTITNAQIKSGSILVAGCGWQQIGLLDAKTQKLTWTYTLGKGEDCNDIECTKENKVLFAYTGGARLIEWDGTTIWDYKCNRGEELFTATQTSTGNYMLAMCGNPSRIVELNKEGKQIFECKFDTGVPRVHSQFRQVTISQQNNFLVPVFAKGEVMEFSRDGKLIKSVKCGGNPFCVREISATEWVVGTGDGHKIVHVNPQTNTIIKSTEGKAIEGVELLFVSELIPCKKGGMLVSNWNGHSKIKDTPVLFEVDKNGKMLWGINTCKEIRNISAIDILKKSRPFEKSKSAITQKSGNKRKGNNISTIQTI